MIYSYFYFESTSAYQWLARNAHNYGFELSFPQGNSQGVSFEPWHWRYVGSPRSSQIFAAARSSR
jgi:LAS superfamily LD-carboxypeptidase LdcB